MDAKSLEAAEADMYCVLGCRRQSPLFVGAPGDERPGGVGRAAWPQLHRLLNDGAARLSCRSGKTDRFLLWPDVLVLAVIDLLSPLRFNPTYYSPQRAPAGPL